MQNKIERAQAVRQRVIQLSAYRLDASRVWHVGMDPLYITSEELSEAQKRGQLIYDYEKLLNTRYVNDCKAGNTSLVVSIIEQGLTPAQVKYQREIASHRPPSLLKRTDEAVPGFIMEVQKRCGGLCLFTIWNRAFKSEYPFSSDELPVSNLNGFVHPYEWMMIQNGISNKVIVLITPKEDLPSQTTLANYINEETEFLAIPVCTPDQLDCIHGSTLVVDKLIPGLKDHGYKLPFNPSTLKSLEIGLIYRRATTLEHFMALPGWDELYKKYMDGSVLIQPELNVLEDSKVPQAIGSQPEFRQDLSLELRALFPTAGFLPDGLQKPFYWGDQVMTLEHFRNSYDRHKRNFVIKYAGSNIAMGMGGRQVYKLEDQTPNSFDKQLAKAFSEIQAGNLWMIQLLDRTRYSMEYLDKSTNNILIKHNHHARINFYYFRESNGNVRLIEASGLVRPHWKATGADNAVAVPIRVKLKSYCKYVERGENACTRRVISQPN